MLHSTKKSGREPKVHLPDSSKILSTVSCLGRQGFRTKFALAGGCSARNHQADAELGGHLAVVVDQAFAVSVEILQIEIAAQVSQLACLQWDGEIELDAVRRRSSAFAQSAAELHAVGCPNLDEEVGIATVVGYIGIVFLLHIGVDLRGNRKEITIGERKRQRGADVGGIQTAR